MGSRGRTVARDRLLRCGFSWFGQLSSFVIRSLRAHVRPALHPNRLVCQVPQHARIDVPWHGRWIRRDTQRLASTTPRQATATEPYVYLVKSPRFIISRGLGPRCVFTRWTN